MFSDRQIVDLTRKWWKSVNFSECHFCARGGRVWGRNLKDLFKFVVFWTRELFYIVNIYNVDIFFIVVFSSKFQAVVQWKNQKCNMTVIILICLFSRCALHWCCFACKMYLYNIYILLHTQMFWLLIFPGDSLSWALADVWTRFTFSHWEILLLCYNYKFVSCLLIHPYHEHEN